MVTVIRNPVAGRGRWASRQSLLAQALDHHLGKGNWREVVPASAEATESATRQAVTHGAAMVVAAGGDGTLNAVARGVAGASVPIGILPIGTGNDVARTLGIGTDPVAAVKYLRPELARPFDAARFRTEQHEGWVLNALGCGFDAVVAERINRGVRYLSGNAAYLAAIVAELSRFRAIALTVTVDGASRHQNLMLCCVANCQSYGGGLKIAPMADPADGRLNVIEVREVGRAEFLRVLPRVFSGRHIGHPRVDHRAGSSVTIEGDRAPVLSDGELVGTTPVTVQVVPGAFRIACPPA
jgi:diacylglycerol kinase (ATP)